MRKQSIVVFETNLKKQKANVTEAGEDIATNNLQRVLMF